MRHEFWTIAYRPRGAQTLLEDTATPFRVIPNTWRYWCADPHLFELDGQTYVFAELYDRVLRRGVIGFCQLTDRGPSKWKLALKTPFHLSYPHIFADKDGIYMIPESYVGGEIALYRAAKFPTKWERIRPIRQNFVAVDTTRIPWDGNTWLLTQSQTDDNTGCLMLMTEDGSKEWIISKNDPFCRPAGPVFRHNGSLIRPAQDCSDGYGKALRFHEITAVGEGEFREHLLTQVTPDQIQSDWKYQPKGIHTYGQSEKYEIIDLKSYEKDPLFTIMRPIWYIWRRMKRIVRK